MDGKEIRKKESEIDISEMLNAQETLDDVAFQNAGVERGDTMEQRTIALVGEIVEVADELTQWWKYWKKNQKPLDFGRVIEELADVLHFILSKGIDNGAQNIHKHVVFYGSAQEQLAGLMRWATLTDSEFGTGNWEHLMATFRGLLEVLGIEWPAMTVAYYMKNKENHERQNNGY